MGQCSWEGGAGRSGRRRPCPARGGAGSAGPIAAPLTTWLFTFLPGPREVLPDPKGLRPGPWVCSDLCHLEGPWKRPQCPMQTGGEDSMALSSAWRTSGGLRRAQRMSVCPLTVVVRDMRAEDPRAPPDHAPAAERGPLRGGPRACHPSTHGVGTRKELAPLCCPRDLGSAKGQQKFRAAPQDFSLRERRSSWGHFV